MIKTGNWAQQEISKELSRLDLKGESQYYNEIDEDDDFLGGIKREREDENDVDGNKYAKKLKPEPELNWWEQEDGDEPPPTYERRRF